MGGQQAGAVCGECGAWAGPPLRPLLYTRHTAVRLGPHGTRHSAGCCPAAAPPHPPAGTRHRTPPPLPRLQQHRGEWVGGGGGWRVSGGGQAAGRARLQAGCCGASPWCLSGQPPPHIPHPHAPRTRGRIDLLDAETQNVEEAGNGHGAGRPRKHHIRLARALLRHHRQRQHQLLAELLLRAVGSGGADRGEQARGRD